jgi:hypothetical protein
MIIRIDPTNASVCTSGYSHPWILQFDLFVEAGLDFGILLLFLFARCISGMDPSVGINGITMWTERDCQGVPASTIFNINGAYVNLSERIGNDNGSFVFV